MWAGKRVDFAFFKKLGWVQTKWLLLRTHWQMSQEGMTLGNVVEKGMTLGNGMASTHGVGTTLESNQSIFLSEDFDPLRVLYDDQVVPPIRNVKPYKTFASIKHVNMLLDVGREGNEKGHGKGIGKRHDSQPLKGINLQQETQDDGPPIQPLPDLPFKDTFTGYLQRKFGDRNRDWDRDQNRDQDQAQNQTWDQAHNQARDQTLNQTLNQTPTQPFNMLYECYSERARIIVRRRDRKGNESILRGTLLGFDKYFNLILSRVVEQDHELEIHYRKQYQLEREKSLPPRSRKRNRKRSVRVYVARERYFPLLFVRGCSVFLISREGLT